MPVYLHNHVLGASINISAFVNHAQLVAPAAAVGALPQLPGPTTLPLGAHQTALLPFGPPQIARAVGLITCACVIYVSTDPAAVAGAWIHHANAGHVAPANVAAAIASLGAPPPASIRVIFAHPNAQDPGYAASIATIAAAIGNANNIVEIPSLMIGQFGIDANAHIGV